MWWVLLLEPSHLLWCAHIRHTDTRYAFCAVLISTRIAHTLHHAATDVVDSLLGTVELLQVQTEELCQRLSVFLLVFAVCRILRAQLGSIKPLHLRKPSLYDIGKMKNGTMASVSHGSHF